MNGTRILYEICLNKKNISMLIEVICEDVKLSKRSIPKCIEKIQEIMKKNISRLNKSPKNMDEVKKIVKFLNGLCISTIIEIIAKKYPDIRKINKNQNDRTRVRSDLDIYGNRENHVPNRPYIKSKKDYDKQNFPEENPDNIGYQANDIDNSYTYASAYDNHLLSSISLEENKSNYEPYESSIGERLKQMTIERGYIKSFNNDPENEHNNHANAMPETDNKDNNIYASLLAAGAPSQIIAQYAQMGPLGPGNPLMPISSSNIMTGLRKNDRLGDHFLSEPVREMQTEFTFPQDEIQKGCKQSLQPFFGGCEKSNRLSNCFPEDSMKYSFPQQSGYDPDPKNDKFILLKNDIEKKLSERRLQDIETNQPPTKDTFDQTNSFDMNTFQIPNVQMNNMNYNSIYG